ncbi:alpha/beta hydrolase [Aeromonas hydrophila]|uniref:alpha/beta hydrolase n=1 Tax=Aeromonas hydrophila TaxID=644 RepID=UPI0022AFB5C1|nr:alpha/beta hydrolase [Aeromonas hydrophila]ELB2793729.1 alpha/beta fold hydrolase [Aeromonas hydrophila]MCZ4332432.1 alpha/beta hydrolase [Aeromonas hydrophila]
MKYTLLMTLLAPALLAGCNLEKKEEPFQARHIRAGYDAGQVCQQLRQGWLEDGIAIPASQVSCHYLMVPLDYDKEWVQIKETKWEKRSAARADSSLFADNSPRFPSWSDKPVRPHVKQETRTVKGNSLDVFYLHYRASGDYRGTLFYNPGGPTSATPDLGLLLDMLRSANPAILEHYDIVTLDPRGAGYSALGHELRSCLLTDKQGVRPDMSPAQLAQLFASRDKGALPALQSGADQGKAFSTALLERCDQPLRLHAPHLGSRAVVEDMERLRQHLGRERITPITFSYGTRLAALYAARYPSHVANLVVDSPMSPAESRYPAIFRGDAENANRILAWRFGDQALQRSMAVTRQVRDDGRYVDNQGNVLDRDRWEAVMSDAISGSQRDDQLAFWQQDDAGSLLARLAKEQADENPYSTLLEMPFFSAIHCTDNSESYGWQTLDPEDAAFQGAGALLLANSFNTCADWPYPRQPIASYGAGEIKLPDDARALVLGAEYDPNTPFAGARQMQAAFGSAARMVQVAQSNQHGQLSSSRCAQAALSTLLLGDAASLPAEQRCLAD